MDYKGKNILAPMVRVGTLPFRLLALEYGADIVYSEEIIDYRLLRTVRVKNDQLGTVDYVEKNTNVVVFRTCEEERGKIVLQLGTADPIRVLKAAEMASNDVSAIDINMGCPKSFSTSGGMGSALLTKPDLICDILKTLNRNLNMPITCKIRLLNSRASTIDLARQIASTGVAAMAVHGRKVADRPRHKAQWEEIKAVCENVHIPVIANGDVYEHSDFDKVREYTGAASAMAARSALWNVSVFRPKGILDWEIVKKDFLRKCVLWDNDVKYTKYVMKEMIIHHSCLELEEGKAINKCKDFNDLCRMYDLNDYYNQHLYDANLKILENGMTKISL